MVTNHKTSLIILTMDLTINGSKWLWWSYLTYFWFYWFGNKFRGWFMMYVLLKCCVEIQNSKVTCCIWVNPNHLPIMTTVHFDMAKLIFKIRFILVVDRIFSWGQIFSFSDRMSSPNVKAQKSPKKSQKLNSMVSVKLRKANIVLETTLYLTDRQYSVEYLVKATESFSIW